MAAHRELVGDINFPAPGCPPGGSTLVAGCGFGHHIGHAVFAYPAEHADRE